MKILALDLAQSQTVACEYESLTAETQFRRVATESMALRKLLEASRPERVVVEIGSVTGWVSILAQALSIPLQVANTAAPAWRWSNTKRKTGRDDALRLAQLSAMNQLPLVYVPRRDVRQWHSLIRFRHHLFVRRTQIKNRIQCSIAQGRPLVAGKSS